MRKSPYILIRLQSYNLPLHDVTEYSLPRSSQCAEHMKWDSEAMIGISFSDGHSPLTKTTAVRQMKTARENILLATDAKDDT